MANATIKNLIGSANIYWHFDAMVPANLFEDTSATDACEDGDAVAAITKYQGVKTWVLSNATSGERPEYRANYNSTGYPGVDFVGANGDVLFSTDPSFTVANLYVLMAVTLKSAIGVNDTLWQFYVSNGNDARVVMGGTGTTLRNETSGSSTAITSAVLSLPQKVVILAGFGVNAHFIDIMADCDGSAGTLSGKTFTAVAFGGRMSAVSPAAHSLHADAVLHEIVVAGPSAELGQMHRAQTLLRSKWGVTGDPSPVPQASGGGGSDWSGGFTG